MRVRRCAFLMLRLAASCSRTGDMAIFRPKVSAAGLHPTTFGAVKNILFPVRLVAFEALRNWECFDADLGKDSAQEVRESYVPDFSWSKKDHDEYRRDLDRLLRDLRASGAENIEAL